MSKCLVTSSLWKQEANVKVADISKLLKCYFLLKSLNTWVHHILTNSVVDFKLISNRKKLFWVIWSAFFEIWNSPKEGVHHLCMHKCGMKNRSGKRNWSVPRVQFNMRLKCLQSKPTSGLWKHSQHCAYMQRPAIIDQQWFSCAQILIGWHTVCQMQQFIFLDLIFMGLITVLCGNM